MTSPHRCGAPIDTVLARLRARPDDIQEALGGNVLAFEIALTEGRHAAAYSIVFSPDGHIAVLTPDDAPASVTPHVRLQGTADQLLAVVLGETDPLTALIDEVMELFAKPADLAPQYPRLMKVVREEVWALLEPG